MKSKALLATSLILIGLASVLISFDAEENRQISVNGNLYPCCNTWVEKSDEWVNINFASNPIEADNQQKGAAIQLRLPLDTACTNSCSISTGCYNNSPFSEKTLLGATLHYIKDGETYVSELLNEGEVLVSEYGNLLKVEYTLAMDNGNTRIDGCSLINR